ncbi:MAG: glycosyl transferase group 1 [Bacteroidetes bacterium]|jgi:glycosyltransferase involved in cell wall biosynthesis|nr:glycosyl transferase group 1 [Bacteroidota bacterium]
MKLGIISSMAAAPWGGSEELWVALGSQALSDGFSVSASVFDWAELPLKIRNLKKDGAAIHLRSRISYTDLKGKIKGKLTQLVIAEKQLQNFVEEEKPDVVFISLGAFCDLEIDSLRKFLLKINIPFFIAVHSNNDSYTVNNSKLEAIRKVCIKAKRVFFVSNRLKQQSERQIAYRFENSSIIINPVNINTLGILPYPDDSRIQFACVGGIQVGVKGQAMLLQILAAKKWKERNWILNIYGHGQDEGLVNELIGLYELKDKVFLRGYASDIRNEVWAGNHILLMPSFIEGMPISLVEAMLCGRTAIVTDVGGNRELIDDLSGFIAEGATPFSLDKALELAWQKKTDWKKMGEVAFEKAIQLYSANSMKNVLDILNKK